jgi:hypothetical protein
VRRFWLSFLVGLFVLTPAIVLSDEKLPSELQLTTQVSPTGDVVFLWNVPAVNQQNFVDLKIGYSYDTGKGMGSFGPADVDPRIGEAAFRNLPLDTDFTFKIRLADANGDSFSQKLTIKTPKPVAQISTDPGVNAQLQYVAAHWQTKQNVRYMYIESNDCANFASQTLVARGFEENSKWGQINKVPTHSFVSATALRKYLLTLPGVRALTDGQRDQVKLGDLVIFDWNRSGDSDHVGVIDYVEKQPDGTVRLFFAQHSISRQYGSVDWAIQVFHPNASVSYLSIPVTGTEFAWSSFFADHVEHQHTLASKK